MRSGEKISIKFLKAFNKLGLLKSLKPLLVKDLAKKIIDNSGLDVQSAVEFEEAAQKVKEVLAS